MSKVKGQIALVTGASSGIGAAIATLLVKEGMIVVGIARRVNRLEELAKSLENEAGEFHYLQVDMTKEEDIKSAFKFIKEKFGKLHVLINNAGVVKNETLSDGDTVAWKQIIDTNLIGVAIAGREAISIMKETKIDGYIVHINSILGHMIPITIGKHLNMYQVSKHGLTAYVETLRQELLSQKLKIRVSSICPGLVATEMLAAAQKSELGKNFKPDTPVLLAEDIADSILFLITRPVHVEIPSITIRPTGEEL